jgi:hypothetical protein
MHIKSIACCALALFGLAQVAHGRGVTPYLPLNLAPEVERQIEEVLILAGKPVMRRPIAAATVLDALPEACKVDRPLCDSVRSYLNRYMEKAGLTHARAEAAATSDTVAPVANRRGMTTDDEWVASAQAYYQPSDYFLLALGGVAHPDTTSPAGSFLSAGFEYAQLDVGYRDRWMSPLTDSAMLISTEAETMPSISISNYTPMTPLGINYEFFLAEMSESDRIVFEDGYTSGNPALFGMQLGIEPFAGWSLSANRIMQFGGGERGGNSIGDVFDAFFRPSSNDNLSDTEGADFGNQAASITTRFLVPGKVPFAFYMEYGGEDTSRSRDLLLGNSSLSVGVDLPRLLPDIGLTYEVSEWQNGWYVHHIYQDGLTNEGRVIGHWGAADRVTGDGVGAQSHMLKLTWTPSFGGFFEARYRTLANESYSDYDYTRMHDLSLRYSRDWKMLNFGAEIQAGRDVFGEDYQRFAAFVTYPPGGIERTPRGLTPQSSTKIGEYFVDAGVHTGELRTDLATSIPRTETTTTGGHIAVGVRRPISNRNDIGVRLDIDDLDGSMLLGVRAIDYRFRLNKKIALSLFAGAARYDLATPAYGIYTGAGVQWRDAFPKYDIGLEYRFADKIARDNLLPDDPPSEGSRDDAFYDASLLTLYVSRRW